MPIEFRCVSCDNLLRTPDETAGRQAKCPACGAVMTVPGVADAPKGDSPFGPAGASPASGPTSFDAGNPYAAAADLGDSGAWFQAAAMPIRPSKIDFSDVITRTWHIFANQWGMCIVVFLLSTLATMGFALLVVGGVVIGVIALELNEIVTVPAIVLAGLASALFSTWITTGATLFYLKTARGLPADISDIFAGGPYYLRVLGGSALFALGLLAIFAAFVVPCGLIGLAFDPAIGVIGLMVGGVLAMAPIVVFHLTFFPYFYLIIDRNMGIIESFAAARDITRGNRLIVLLIVLVVMLVGSAINQVTCNLGVLVVTPFTMLLYPVVYLLLIGHPTAGPHARPNPTQR